MVTSATGQFPPRRKSRRRSPTGAQSVLAICGSLIALFGIVLMIVSDSLSLENSLYLLFAGFGLVLSGALLAKRHVAGAWAYLAAFAATLAWSLHNAGLGGSSVGYRIVGPIIMLVMLALLMPALGRWSRTRTLGMLSFLIIATVLVGDLSDGSNDPAADPAAAIAQFHKTPTTGVLQ